MPRRAPSIAQLTQARAEFLRRLLPCTNNCYRPLSCSCGTNLVPMECISRTARLPNDEYISPRHSFHTHGHCGSGCPTPLTASQCNNASERYHEPASQSSRDWGGPSAVQNRLQTSLSAGPPPISQTSTDNNWHRAISCPSASPLGHLPPTFLKKAALLQLRLPALMAFSNPMCSNARLSRLTQIVRPCSTHSSDFTALGVAPELQERLSTQGLQMPLPVQAVAVPLILNGRNTAIKSCTGSGKTLAYLLPVVQLALERRRAAEAAVAPAAAAVTTGSVSTGRSRKAAGVTNNSNSSDSTSSSSSSSTNAMRQQPSTAALKRLARCTQAVIIASSRELCIQIQRTAQDLIPGPPGNRRLIQQLIGGANSRRQEAALAGGEGGGWPLVVVGTPGRVADMITQGSLHVWNCPLLVLDEVDQLYAQEDLRQHVDTICAHVGRRVQHSPQPDDPSTSAVDVGVLPNSLGTASSGGSSSILTAALPADPKTGMAGLGGGGSVANSRQTVIVSASLDLHNAGRYAAWCPDPGQVILSSLQALPPSLLKELHSAPKGGAEPQGIRVPESSDGSRDSGGGGSMDAIGRSGLGSEHVNEGGQRHNTAGPLMPSNAEELCGPSGSPVGQCGVGLGEQPGVAATAAEALVLSSSSGNAFFHSINNANDSCSSKSSSVNAAPMATTMAAAKRLSDVLPPHLAHLYVLCHSKHRTDRVRRVIHALGAERVLLFVPKQNQTMVTKYRLEARHMEVTVFHGRLSKLERGNIMEAFRRGVFRAMVVTDLGARGLDLPDCDTVINFGPPADALSYAHRAGRTGRAGAPGIVVSIVTRLELPSLLRIAKQLGVNLQAASVSHGTLSPGEEAEGSRESEGAGDSSRDSFPERECNILNS